MSISKLHKTALQYARDGIPVLPCKENTKLPATEHGFKDATTNEDTINTWWNINPNYNVAIYPGPAGLAVIDEEYDSKSEWISGHKLPDTFTVLTPKGGKHLYFDGEFLTNKKLGPRTDARGRSGYVLVPPSVVDGKSYKIARNIEVAPLPAWVIEKQAAPERAEFAPDITKDLPGNVLRAVAYLAGLPAVTEGQGSDDAAFRAVAALRELGLSDSKTFDVMRDHFNCEPLDDDWLHQKVVNGFKFAQNAPGTSAVPATQEVFGGTLDRILPPTEKRSRFYPEDDLEMDQTPAARWVVKDVLQEGSTCMIYGPTQSYKSFIAIDLALAIATGRETFGTTPGVTGPVFYGALEGRADVKRTRRPAWRLAKGIKGKTEFYVLPAPMLVFPEEQQEFVAQIKAKCGARIPRLIVLDTVSKMMVGLDATHDAPKLIRFCEGLTETFLGCTVIAIHHSGHDINKGPRDSTVYRAGFDSVIQVTAPAKRVCEVKIIKHKESDEPENPFTFKLIPTAQSLVIQPTTAEEHAELTFKEDESDTITKAMIAAALTAQRIDTEDKGLTARALASLLVPGGNEAAIKSAMSKLSRISGSVRGYFSGEGPARRWHMPPRK